MAKAVIAQRIADTQERLDWAVNCHEDYLTQERAHRIARRRAEHRLRESDPKMPASALELLLESDKEYLSAFVLWKSAQIARKRADGEYEIAKMAAWAAIRALG